jgi:hypothetical protein
MMDYPNPLVGAFLLSSSQGVDGFIPSQKVRGQATYGNIGVKNHC